MTDLTPADGQVNSSASRRRITIVLGIVVVVVAAAAGLFAFTQDGDPDVPPTTDTTSATPTVNAAEQAVLNDYRAFWDSYLAAANPMRPDYPGLQKYATTDELRLLVNRFSAAKDGNQIFKGTIDTNAKVETLTDQQATVRDCLFDHTGAYDATTGERLDEEDTQRQLNVIQLTHEGDNWKVASITKESDGCTAP